MISVPARVVVLDIEGTTGSASHVHDVLFPFARRRLAHWFAAHRGDPRRDAVLAAVSALTGRAELDEAAAVTVLEQWSDDDVKAAPLKTVQGLIWAQGYADGSLTGHVYREVPGQLRRWRSAGTRVFTYSSGSAAAQLDWFRHTAHGDLSVLLHGRFDLDSAGPKDDPLSYRRISRAIRAAARHIVFLSDTARELDAAAAAGWQTVGVRRSDDERGPLVPGHPTVPALDLLRVEPVADTVTTHPGGSAPGRDEESLA
ncbi:acireductone synthase [Streptomyces sp. NPDC047841]|uniref:acireductone synthase n=1 Tax=Streptomyces sp. NPDC047841 TaxID=3154708 RepID=UPI003454158B